MPLLCHDFIAIKNNEWINYWKVVGKGYTWIKTTEQGMEALGELRTVDVIVSPWIRFAKEILQFSFYSMIK